MDRRSFLKAVGGAAAAAVAVPALVLPVRAIALSEPARKFFLPPEQGWLPDKLPELKGVRYLRDEQHWHTGGSALSYIQRLQPATTHYRITGYYDPDLPLPSPGETVMLEMPNRSIPVRAMITEYTTEKSAARETTISVRLVSMPADGPEPLNTVNMRHPISWTTWRDVPAPSIGFLKKY